MRMIQKKLLAVPFAMGVLFLAGAGQSARAATDTTVLTLDINDYTTVSATANVTVEPTLSEVIAGSVVDADAIELTIDSTSGAKITWEGDGSDGTGGTIKDADITLSSNGTNFIAGDNTTALYTSSVAQSGVVVPIDIKISNLGDYAIGQHVNTLTFTVVAN